MSDDELTTRLTELEQENRRLRDELERGRNNERFVDSIVENIPDMIFVKDAAELRFVRFNSAGERLLGASREALIGRNDRDLFPHEEAEFFIAKDREVLAAGALVDIPEEPIHTRHGARWLHTKKIPILGADGNALFLLGISEDITQRKQVEEALAERSAELAAANARLTAAERGLRASESRLRSLLAHFPGAMWVVDPDLRFTSAEGALAGALGLTRPGIVGDPVEDVLPRGPEADVGVLHREALAGARHTYEFHHDGRTYEVLVEPLPEGEGVLGVALDVSERRRVEGEKLRARLERAQRLELLGLLAGGIAHDFNNLLAAIMGYASLVRMRMEVDTQSRRFVERIEQSASLAADLTRQLLAYSGKGRFVVERVDVSRMVEEIGALMRVTISKNVSLNLDLARDLPPCDVDIAQLRQLVLNLLTNASDAIGDRTGIILVATGVVHADREYLSHAWLDESLPEGRYVWLEVSDTGVGMDAATQNQMFDPFFSTKSKGHGLGLAATLGIVRGHRGAIRVYSELGRGTTIKVLFPVAPGVAAPAPPPEPVAAALPTGACVLVVDDEPVVRDLARDTLEGAGLRVLTAADGLEGLQVFRANEDDIRAVVLDMTMPRMGGEATFRELRRLRPGVRVLLISGYNEQEATSRFAGKGVAGFLQKPFRAEGLVGAVRKLLV